MPAAANRTARLRITYCHGLQISPLHSVNEPSLGAPSQNKSQPMCDVGSEVTPGLSKAWQQPETLTMAGKAPAGHSNRPFCRSEPGCWHRMFQADRRWSVGRSTVGPFWLPRRLRCRRDPPAGFQAPCLGIAPRTPFSAGQGRRCTAQPASE